MAQVVEHLPGKELSLNSNTTKKRKDNRKKPPPKFSSFKEQKGSPS
jgi:hypothetical protein